jgi:hypothetical protein
MAKNQTTTSRQRTNNADVGTGVAGATAGEELARRDTGTRTADRGGDAAAARRRPTAEEIAKREPKEYVATDRGYADGRIIEPGERFATKADQGSWMEPVKKASAKQGRLERAVSDTQSPISDDADLTTFSVEALQAHALSLGLTNATGLSKDDLIAAIRAAHDEDRAR